MRTLFSIFLLFLVQAITAQEPVLDSLEINSGNYKFYFVWKGLTEDPPTYHRKEFYFEIDSTKSFLIQDQQQLLDLQSNWTGIPTNEMLWCGYDYYVYIVKDSKVEHELRVNLSCGHMVTDYGNFNFEGNPFEQLKNKIPISVITSKHETLKEGRNFVAALSPKIILPSHEFWFDYDGSFNLHRDYKGKEKEQEFIERVEQMYQNKQYYIRLTGGGAGSIFYTVYADSVFYEQFEFEQKFEWRPLKPNRITYFTENTQLLHELLK